MRLLHLAVIAAAGIFIPAGGQAAYINISFEGIASYPNNNDVLVENFYNGGVSSVGTSGVNYGITFGSNSRVLCLNSQTVKCSNASRGGISDFADSLMSGLAFVKNGVDYINVENGFDQSFSFNYAMFDGGISTSGHSVALFTGLNGTGTNLGSINLTTSAPGCPDYGNAQFCQFKYQGMSVNGVARSIAFTNTGLSQIAIDDITFVNAFAATVPEPATWGMVILGFGIVGASMRNQRRKTMISFG